MQVHWLCNKCTIPVCVCVGGGVVGTGEGSVCRVAGDIQELSVLCARFCGEPKSTQKKKKTSLFKKLDETDSEDGIRKPYIPLFILISMKERRKESVKNQDIDVSIKISLNCYFN